MNRKKKALLLASALSLCVLCGCGEAKTVEIDGETYIQNGDEYTKIEITSRVFEPGEHVINYTSREYDVSGRSGWGLTNLHIPDAPEGYRYVETIPMGFGGYGSTDRFVHIFVNVQRVEAMGSYNSKTNNVEYNEPGVVVIEKTLEMGD